MKHTALWLAVCTLVFTLGLQTADVQKAPTITGKPALVPGEVVVIYDAAVKDAGKSALMKRYGLTKKRDSRKAGKFSVYHHGNPKAILKQLNAEPGVVVAEQNAYAYKFDVPNDPLYSPYQWHMTKIGMESAWDVSTGSGVVVAVIDTGVKKTLEDLAGTQFTAGYDFVNNDTDPTDDEGHGSHVCGTIAQTTNNGVGVAGIAYNATIMAVKVLNQRGSGTYDDIADGIIWAADHGAHVINLSLGGSSSLQILEDAVNYAWNQGVVVVCAAGNDGVSTPFYPAAYTNSISVSATTYLDTLASYSNYGSTIDISAPGGDSGDNNGDGYDDMILQNTFSRNSEGYYFYAGTSMASPHVAGVAALVKSANPSLSNSQVRSILESSAKDLGASGWDSYFGHGRVDAYAAVLAAGGSTPENQPPSAGFTFSVADLNVSFTDTSSDSDGTVEAWAWDFGDGATSSAQNPEHNYAAAGTYSVGLTVTDNDGATDTVIHNVTVESTTPENQPPSAAFTFAVADLNVTFTDASSDSDGTVEAWAWNFGDGATSSAQNPEHNYAAAGTYSVGLTVTDNEGATDTVIHDVTVSSGGPNPTMHVADISMSITKRGRNYAATAVVTVVDAGNSPISNATVTVSWSGVVSGSASGVTGTDGRVSFTSGNVKSSGPFTVTVTDVAHTVYDYDPAANVETTDSITY
ncbi:MAG TPA: PKD domain-containing protein [Candidatus Aminicenantes bacterium]|nr:PKD domain-containing protein [Candidatus Aminicenantes bacterium]